MPGQIDNEKVNTQINKLMVTNMGPLVIGIFVAISLSSLINIFIDPTPFDTQLLLIDLITIVLTFFCNALLGRGYLPQIFSFGLSKQPFWKKHIIVLMTIMLLGLVFNILFSHYYSQNPILHIYLVVTFFAMGSLIYSSLVFGIIFLTCMLGWISLTKNSLPMDSFARELFILFTSGALAYIFLRSRLSLQKKIITSNINDLITRNGLKTSLDVAEREMKNRRRAESQKEQLEIQLAQSKKLEAIGRLAGGVAHDINNMLASISGVSQAMKLELKDSSTHTKDVETILEACNRGKNLTSNLLGFAQKGKYKRERIDLNKLVLSVFTFMERSITNSILFEKNLAKNLKLVEGDPRQINQVLINLINNAVDAMDDHGHLILKTENVSQVELHGLSQLEKISDNYIKITVSDTGSGMDEATIERAFEPFFSTKATGTSTGLGLSMVYGTITNHGGTVLIRSATNQGTTVTIYLPEYHRDSLPLSSDIGIYQTPAVGGIKLMLVDDEPLVRRSGKRILSQKGYDLVAVASGMEAIDIYKKQKSEIDVILLDLIMPEMDGEETFNKLIEINPEVIIIFVSAFSKDSIRVDNLLKRGAFDFIQKPFSADEIDASIHRAISAYN